MSKMIQVRNVPDRMHEALVERARARGLTLTQYVQAVLERELSRPDPKEIFARIRTRERVRLASSADLLRLERGTSGGE